MPSLKYWDVASNGWKAVPMVIAPPNVAMDAAHFVGGPGEPPFQNGAINLDNNAAVPGTGSQRSVGFRKYPDGKVRLFGVIRVVTGGQAAFTLPVGYRPRASEMSIPIYASGGMAIVSITSAGLVQPGSVVGNVGIWAYLDGVEFDTEFVTAQIAPPIAPIPLVTALPPAPVDGQEVYFRVDPVDSSPSIIWHLRYRAGSGQAQKWEYIGGPPLMQHTGANVMQTSVTTQGWVDGGLAGPVLTAPLTGVYLVSAGFEGWTSYASIRDTQAGISVAGAADPIADPVNYNWSSSVGYSGVPMNTAWDFVTRNAVAAGATFRMLFWRDAIAAYNFRQRYLSILPLRVA